MDTSTTNLIPILFGITLLIGIAFGIYQYLASKRAKRTHERSAAAEVRNEPYHEPDGVRKSEAVRRADDGKTSMR